MEDIQPTSSKAKISTHDRVILSAALGYMVIISAFMVWHQEFFSPDRFFVFAFVGMIFLGRAWAFFLDWLPPMLLILGYDYLRGVVPQLTTKAHIHLMIYFDTAIFHTVPTIWLQQHFFTNGHIRWYDNAAVILYFMHFIIPLLIALLFWLLDRTIFKQYMTAMVVLSYLAFITYYIFPATPPWLASQQGFLPPVAHIMDQVLAHFAHPISLPTVYQYVGANLVAAVPSLHAAYPLMTALFVFKKWPRFGLLSFLYPLCMWVAVVYLGEHYVFDVVIGIIYTLAIYAAVVNYKGLRTKIKNFVVKLFKSKTSSELARE